MRNPALAFRPEPSSIPDQPGCYLWRDRHGRVVYVGKAKSLRSRLSNYFGPWHSIAHRTRAMLEAARSVEWIVVDTEVESLHLEYTLIQRHKPRYNVRYTDDKSYPYLVLTTSEEVPRARVRRGKIRKEDRKFGPYAHAYAIRETLDLVLRVYPVRTCSQGIYDRAERTGKPCLLFHIGKCSAPCTGEVSKDEHRALVDGMAGFLAGDTKPVLRQLEEDMRDAAQAQHYESAARLRDQLFAARKALEKQSVVSAAEEDFDVVNVHGDHLEAAFQAFFVRRGRIVGRKGWTVDRVEQLTDAELLTSFLLTLYEERPDDVPALVVVPEQPDDADTLATLLGELRSGTRGGDRGPRRSDKPVALRVPERGEKVDVLATVGDNARQAFERNRLRRGSDFNARSQALQELQAALGMEEAPLRIECYDISHLGGTEVVASMVVFEDGLPRKSEYRRFKLSIDRNDDFAAMREVMTRRFRAYLAEQHRPAEEQKFAYPPNLVIIDGGPGQLSSALAGVATVVAEQHGRTDGRDGDAAANASAPGARAEPEEADLGAIPDVQFVSLAKRFEELYLPGRSAPVVLPRGSEALYLVQRLRDEAHRFAITYQRSRRTASIASSDLDAIPGVGPARRQALLQRWGSVRALRSATIPQLMEVQGFSRTMATTVHDWLHGDEQPVGSTADTRVAQDDGDAG